MGVVAAPHDLRHADVVTDLGVGPGHAGCANGAVAAEVVRGRHGEVAAVVAELGAEEGVVVVMVEHAQQRRQHPALPGFRDAGLEPRVAFEDPAPEHEDDGPVGPEEHFGNVDAEAAGVVCLVGLREALAEEVVHGAGAGVEANHDARILARFPERVVAGVVVGFERAGEDQRDHHAAESVFGTEADFLHGSVDIPQQRAHGNPEVPHPVAGAEFGQPAVVGPGAGPLQVRHDAALRRQGKARTERRRVLLGDAVREDDLPGDAVAVQHFQAMLVVPGAG